MELLQIVWTLISLVAVIKRNSILSWQACHCHSIWLFWAQEILRKNSVPQCSKGCFIFNGVHSNGTLKLTLLEQIILTSQLMASFDMSTQVVKSVCICHDLKVQAGVPGNPTSYLLMKTIPQLLDQTLIKHPYLPSFLMKNLSGRSYSLFSFSQRS